MAEILTEMEAVREGFHVGSVKWFDEQRGFGFIIDDEGGPDVFCHAVQFQRGSVKAIDGMRIAFKARQGPKGLAAAEVAAVKEMR